MAFLFILNVCVYAQRSLPATENFNYSVGNLPTNNTDWKTWITTPGDTAQVILGNLEYPNYPMPTNGNRLSINQPENGQMTISTLHFTAIKNPGDKIYVAFLLQVMDQGSLSEEGARYFGLANVLLDSYSHQSVTIRLRLDSTNHQVFYIGLTKGANDPIWSPIQHTFSDTTILLVLCYKFVEGADNNDTAKLWINPDLSGSEPTANIIAPGHPNNGDDPDSLCYFFVRAKESPEGSIDAIRIATDWASAPLPVELSQFSASIVESHILLDWKTETEVNNYGFLIQKKNSNDKNNNWENLKFINGHGNSNVPNFYSYVDYDIVPSKYFYRLVQIDNDGKFEFSKIIEVDFSLQKNFELYQNYPNPFNPSTKISFYLPEDGKVKFVFYNSIGQEIRNSINQYHQGVNSFEFNASDLQSGVYLYKLDYNTSRYFGKMILIR